MRCRAVLFWIRCLKNTKAVCVYEKLETLNGELFVAHLKFVMKDQGNVRATIEVPDNYNPAGSPDVAITIVLSSNSNELRSGLQEIMG